ncbi:MAG: DinB family protein [Acidobacteriota bacterium]
MGKLTDQLDAMEKKRAELLELIEQQEPEALRRPPSPEKWSILQILWHLMDAEQRSVAMVRKQLQSPKRYRTGLKNAFKSLTLRAVLAVDIPIKAPPVVSKVPPTETLDLATLVADWDSTRADWRQVAVTLPADRHRDALFKHPIAGKLSFAQALSFQENHADRHARQVRKILGQ